MARALRSFEISAVEFPARSAEWRSCVVKPVAHADRRRVSGLMEGIMAKTVVNARSILSVSLGFILGLLVGIVLGLLLGMGIAMVFGVI